MSVHVTVLVEQRYVQQEQPHGLVAALQSAGHRVDVLTLAERPVRDGEPPSCWSQIGSLHSDVVVARGRAPYLLDLLGLAEKAGIPVVDHSCGIAAVRDKTEMSRLLGPVVPVPNTWWGTPQEMVRLIPDEAYPVICKPVHGDNGRGLVVVESAAGLGRLPWREQTMLVQTYLPNQGVDLKLYVIDEQVFPVRKPSPVTPLRSDRLGPVKATTEMFDLADRCREIFGLTVFGVDCLQTPDGLSVIEVNDFPNYSMIPNSSALLRDHVLAMAA